MTNPIDVTTRGGKGSALTTGEMDTNLTNLARVAIQSISNEDAGNVELANEATTINLADAQRPVVPEHLQAGVEAVLAASDFSIASDGYWKIPGLDLIVQWGTGTITDLGSASVTSYEETLVWPIPFENSVFLLIGGGKISNSTWGIAQAASATVALVSLDGLTGADIAVQDWTSAGQISDYYWLAIGN